MKKAVSAVTMIVGAGTVLLAGYVLLNSLADIRRYIRISTM
jgi:hypothetical protein